MTTLKMRPRREQLLRNIGIGLVILLLTLSIVGLYGQPLTQEEEVSLTRVAEEIASGTVANIGVEQEDIKVALKDSGEILVAQKEVGSSVTETFTNLGVSQEQLRDIEFSVKKPSGFSYWVATLAPALLPFILLAAFLWFMMRSAQSAGNRALSFGQTTQRPIEPGDAKRKTTFKDVAGNVEAKQELEEIVEFLKTPKKFQKLGARTPKGVLLVGPPGTGKTLISRAVAGEAEAPFFSISGSDFVEMFVGVGASRVRDLFRKVKQHAPAILFIDELDAVGRQRGAGLGGGHDEREQTLNQILVEMDGFEQSDNVIVLAATNRPDVLDPALLRPGRFDRQVIMELPDIREREAIINIHVAKVPLAKNVDLRRVAERTPGFSGADLANLVNEAAISAARADQVNVNQRAILEAIEKVLLGPEKRSKVFSKREKEVTAYHEAGHAVVAYYMPHTDPVRKISIISRGHAGGYTLKLPEEDKRLHSKSEFLGELATLMGGHVAEQLIFEELTTGASNDLQKASALARRLVTEWGMSDLGPITFGQKDEYIFLGKELHEARNYSESTATRIDEEVSKMLTEARSQAEAILKANKEKFELVARTLIKKETIEQAAFNALMDGTEKKAAVKDEISQEPGPSPVGGASPAPAAA